MSDMNALQFRTALGGFHKGDVADYISKTAQAHQTALAEKDHEIKRLEQENKKLTEQASMFQLMMQLDEAPAQSEQAEPKAEAEAMPEADCENVSKLELAAYRRAEAAERLARERARKLYQALDEVCLSTSSEYQSVKQTLQDSLASLEAQMNTIRESISRLEDSARSGQEKIEAMDALIPDPAEGLEDVPGDFTEDELPVPADIPAVEDASAVEDAPALEETLEIEEASETVEIPDDIDPPEKFGLPRISAGPLLFDDFTAE